MTTPTRILLACGIAAAVLFLAMDLIAAFWLYPRYDYTAQQVSELSAIGAPSRPFWMAMSYPYTLLALAFAAGVWRAGRGRLALRICALLIALFALNGFFWPPMHMRGATFSDTDTLHLAFAVSAVVLILGYIVSGALALGRGFRIYSAVTIVLMVASGGIVGTQVQAIVGNRPTPWMGLVERIGVHGSLLWLAVFALMLLGDKTASRKQVPRPFPEAA